jgi:DNA-binding PadR family transcriptional regulator
VEDLMANKRKVGNPLALAVLSYLTMKPMHPYELSRTLRDNGDARSIKFNHGSLYMVVQQLARAGFIAEIETSREGQRPERTVYAITDDGRREAREWLSELIAQPEHEYPHFVTALSLVAALPPDQVVPLLRTRLEALAGQRAEIQGMIGSSLAQGVPRLFLVEEEYRLALLDTELAFVERFIAEIGDPEAGWGPALAAVT